MTKPFSCNPLFKDAELAQGRPVRTRPSDLIHPKTLMNPGTHEHLLAFQDADDEDVAEPSDARTVSDDAATIPNDRISASMPPVPKTVRRVRTRTCINTDFGTISL